MRKKLCYLLSAILAFGIVAPGGTTTATGLGNSIPAQVLQQGPRPTIPTRCRRPSPARPSSTP